MEDNRTQNRLFKYLIEKSIPVEIYLSTGKRLEGKILSFDNFSVLLEDNGYLYLLYKNNIASVTCGKRFRAAEIEELMK
ncbi:RNA chaperone Hfq [Desulfurobacterium sp.]